MTHPRKTHVSIVPAISYLLLSLAANAACSLLLYLAHSGSGVAASLSGLPVAVVLLTGALFSGALYHRRREMEGDRPLNVYTVVGTAVIVNLGVAAVAARYLGAPFNFVLAPLAAIAIAELLPRLFKQAAPMLAAMLVYIVCTLLANFTFDTFLQLPGFGLLSVGTLFFGVTFTQRDRVHRYGRKNVYAMIFAAALANLIMSTLLGIPLRFLLAGFLAIVLAEAADTEVYQRLIKRNWLTRVATSNAVSIPLDSSIFTFIAFAFNPDYPLPVLLEIIYADVITKTVVGLLVAVRLSRGRLPTTA